MVKGMKNMIGSSYSIKVPGKLMIAGEYAVLEPGNKAIVVAVDRYIRAHIKVSQENILSLPQLGLEDIKWSVKNGKVEFSVADPRLSFIQNSITVVSQFLKEKSIGVKRFHLKIESQLNEPVTGKKYGLGSSAAIVVAVVSAILSIHSFHNEKYELDEIFKLSVIAHFKSQGSGSGADIAAALYGGWLQYSAFSGQWLLSQLKEGTKEAASTKFMIKRISDFRKEDPASYNEFLRESAIFVDALIESFKAGNIDEAIKNLKLNRKALLKLGEKAGLEIETEELKKLASIAEAFGSGKQSGAGGGDCGIAFIKNPEQIEDLYRAWELEGIIPLNLKVSKKGLSIEEVCED
jgi:phosphomevalonate kinase